MTLSWPLSEPLLDPSVLDPSVLDVHSIVDLGTHIVVNRTTRVDPSNPASSFLVLPALALDLATEEPELLEMPFAGIVTEWAIGS